jgi:hypothetical protein
MNRLNGWQRIWVVLAVLWVIPVAFFAFADPPRYNSGGFGSDARVAKHMPTRAWQGSECNGDELKSGGRKFRFGQTQEWNGEQWRVVLLREVAAELRRDLPEMFGGLSDEQTKTKMDDLRGPAVVQFIKVAAAPFDARVVLCFDTHVSDAEMNRILNEYADSYTSAWWRAVAGHVGVAFLFWLIPGVALYALGWSIGWTWRGFRK